MTCPHPDDLALARIAPGLRSEVAEHARRCPACRQAWEALSALEEWPAAAALAPAPEQLAAATLARLEQTPPPQRQRAEVVFDSRRAAAATALRGQGIAVRHLALRAQPWELDLALLREPDSGKGTLVGHLFDARAGAAAGGRAPSLRDAWCLLAGPAAVRQTALQSDGSFRFADMADGAHDLLIEADGLQIVAPELSLPAHDGDEALP